MENGTHKVNEEYHTQSHMENITHKVNGDSLANSNTGTMLVHMIYI